MAETTLNEIVLKIARRLGRSTSGTATGGTTTTLIDTAALWQPDNAWAAHYLRFLTGSNADIERLITSHSQSAKTLTFNPATSIAAAADDQYMILPLEYKDFTDAIGSAVDSAGSAWMAIRDDTTSLSFNGAQEYALPADVALVYQVWSGDGTTWAPIYTYEILGRPGAYKLVLRDHPGSFTPQAVGSSTMRILYAAILTTPQKPYGTLDMGEDREAVLYVEEMALYFIHQTLWSRNPTGEQARSHMSKSQQHRAEAAEIKARRRISPPSVTVQRRRYAEQI